MLKLATDRSSLRKRIEVAERLIKGIEAGRHSATLDSFIKKDLKELKQVLRWLKGVHKGISEASKVYGTKATEYCFPKRVEKESL